MLGTVLSHSYHTRKVYDHHCLVEVPNSVIENVLSAYGDVISVESCYYDCAAILTGSRVVKMSIRRDIPPRIYVLRYPCRVWYRDQPLTCLICSSLHHRALDCPLRGKCRNYRQPGHFARDCTVSAPSAVVSTPTLFVSDAPAPSDIPRSPSAASMSASPDDVPGSESEPDELGSSDEEVLAAAGNVSLSPRRACYASKRPADSPVSSDVDHPSAVYC